jgi:hypothetical protein
MKGTKILSNSDSNLYVSKGHKIENISNRLVGVVFFKYKTRFGWSKWKKRWMEVFDTYMIFYKYSVKRRRSYKKTIIYYTNHNYKLSGLECEDEMFILGITKNTKKKYFIRTPHETSFTLLYPNLKRLLDASVTKPI